MSHITMKKTKAKQLAENNTNIVLKSVLTCSKHTKKQMQGEIKKNAINFFVIELTNFILEREK